MTGLNGQDYAAITATVLIREDNGEYRHHQIFDAKRAADDLSDYQTIEAWALEALNRHADAIRCGLAADINRGSRTLIEDVPINHKV
jgi:ABC-type uncharacterized transport system auxiliary subunit